MPALKATSQGPLSYLSYRKDNAGRNQIIVLEMLTNVGRRSIPKIANLCIRQMYFFLHAAMRVVLTKAMIAAQSVKANGRFVKRRAHRRKHTAMVARTVNSVSTT